MSATEDPPLVTHWSVDMRYRYIHKCEGCDGSFAECQPLWREHRKCCPDCTHARAFPPPRHEPEPEGTPDDGKPGVPFDL